VYIWHRAWAEPAGIVAAAVGATSSEGVTVCAVFSCWYGQLLAETVKVVVVDVDHWTSKDFMAHFSLYATILMIAFIVLRVLYLQRTHPRLMR